MVWALQRMYIDRMIDRDREEDREIQKCLQKDRKRKKGDNERRKAEEFTISYYEKPQMTMCGVDMK